MTNRPRLSIWALKPSALPSTRFCKPMAIGALLGSLAMSSVVNLSPGLRVIVSNDLNVGARS
jgi:hypothetical protein